MSTVEVEWIVEHPKILNYLLDLTHPEGGPKAKYLLRFGFKPERPELLARALVDHAMSNLPGRRIAPPKGTPRIVFEGTVVAPDGRDMPLRTVWEPYEPPPQMRFLTAVPLTR